MHDKNGKVIHVGDQVSYTGGTFHVNGAVLDDGTVVGGNVAGAKHVAQAQDVEIVEKRADNVERVAHGPGCIVWGNGPAPPPQPNAE